MLKKSLTELSISLKNKECSSVELTKEYLQQINKHNKTLNAFITVTEEAALTAAKQADEKIATGNAGPLTGLPIAHKDLFCTQGVKTTCASKILDNFVAPYNATIIEKFNAAGMVMLGKTNMDEFAMGSANENSHYGAVKNPWDLNCIPGGSSGGSAAAIAGLLTPAATGTDTGGSIRQPAALCGISGIKPTYGRVSRYGMVAFASSLDQGGPMARSAEDLALLLNIMAGFDERDSTSAEIADEDFTAELNTPLSGLKVGLPKEYFNEHLNPAVASAIQDLAKLLEKNGASIIDISLPNSDLAVPAYYVVAPAECSSNLSRFDGVRYGYRCENPQDLNDLYERSRSEGFGAEVKRRIMVGTYALSAGYYDAYYIKAQQLRRLIRNDFAKALEQVDVILSPTYPNTAFKMGEKSADPTQMYLEDIYTVAANLAGLPGISIPAGFANNMPIGAQFISNYFTESKLLNVAHQIQQLTDWHLQTPEGF